MGVFDLFGKNPKQNSESTRNSFKNLNASQPQEDVKKGPVSIFAVKSYEDVALIIDAIKAGKTAVVHLTELKTETAIRVLDMLSGAIYALGGGIYEMQKNVFMFSPTGVELN